MKAPFDNKERRSHPRFIIDLPLEYLGRNDSCLRGAILVNASKGGFLIEMIRDIPVGTELSITVLYPKGFELADFKVTAKIVWKGPCWKVDSKGNQYWKGYHYGLEFIGLLDEERWKLISLLGDRFESKEILPSLSCQL